MMGRALQSQLVDDLAKNTKKIPLLLHTANHLGKQ
jgi:hypothetical protein